MRYYDPATYKEYPSLAAARDDVIDMGPEEVATMLLAYERIALAYADTEAEEQTARERIKMLAIDLAEAMGVLQCNTTDK